MKRPDRLPALMALLKDGGWWRSADLAARLGVTERTVWRDMDAIRAMGLPLEAVRGRGYRIGDGVTLPALVLTDAELEALHVGLAAVAQGDAGLGDAARSLAAKLDEALPEDGGAPVTFAVDGPGLAWRAPIRAAMRARQKLEVEVAGAGRRLWPLRLDYWGRVWTLVAWDEGRGGFDELRLDQIEALRPLPRLFVTGPGRDLATFDARRRGSGPA
ncbi:MAG: helix-turn-helix transcriptional regulator [Paracoccaceae bacterium]